MPVYLENIADFGMTEEEISRLEDTLYSQDLLVAQITGNPIARVVTDAINTYIDMGLDEYESSVY